MSLVNKMLTDLEARQNSSADRDPPGHVYRDLHPPAGTSKRLWPIVVVFLVCTMAIAVVGVLALDRWEFGTIAEWAVDWDKAVQQQVALVVRAPVAERRRNDSGGGAAQRAAPPASESASTEETRYVRPHVPDDELRDAIEANDAELQQVIEAWPALPATLRTGLVALVRAALDHSQAGASRDEARP